MRWVAAQCGHRSVTRESRTARNGVSRAEYARFVAPVLISRSHCERAGHEGRPGPTIRQALRTRTPHSTCSAAVVGKKKPATSLTEDFKLRVTLVCYDRLRMYHIQRSGLLYRELLSLIRDQMK